MESFLKSTEGSADYAENLRQFGRTLANDNRISSDELTTFLYSLDSWLRANPSLAEAKWKAIHCHTTGLINSLCALTGQPASLTSYSQPFTASSCPQSSTSFSFNSWPSANQSSSFSSPATTPAPSFSFGFAPSIGTPNVAQFGSGSSSPTMPSATSSFSESQFQANRSKRDFKILVVGESGVGKTAFLSRHAGGNFIEDHTATTTPNVVTVTFPSTHGLITLRCWDIPGTIKNPDESLKGADAFLLFFDVASRMSYQAVPRYHNSIQQVAPTPVGCLVGNKVDLKDRKIKPKMITFHRKKNLNYYDVSAKSLYNMEKPFLYICRKLLGDPNLTFSDPTVSTRLPCVDDNEDEDEEEDDDEDEYD
ncbi:GTP-binding nuclear protein Ran [Pelomyxa schiedti]|nr:GTP-binding nuclear protein Ran [Pelomyxa schiedti]